MASSVKVRVMSSVASSACCWRIRLASGSVRMRRRSSRLSAFSSTRIGSRPCSSGSRSEGLAMWKAPEAMNNMWSVFTGPCLVETVVPSISGSRVALHALAGDVGAGAILARGHLVDLVDEDDAGVLRQGDRFQRCGFLVDQLVAFLGDQREPGGGDGGAVRLGALAERLAHHLREVQHAHRGAGLAGDVDALERRGRIGQRQLDLLVVQLAGAQLLAEGVAGGRAGARPHQRVEDALLGRRLRLGPDPGAASVADHADGDLDQVADDLVDVRGRRSRPR